jgi:hypothetical protein
MMWYAIFLFGILCAIVAVGALAFSIVTAALLGLFHCVERSFASFTDGRVIIAALYVVPATLFVCGLTQLISLAFSFVTTVVLR